MDTLPETREYSSKSMPPASPHKYLDNLPSQSIAAIMRKIQDIYDSIEERSQISNNQYTIGTDFTQVYCSIQSIDSKCTLFPHATITWQAWSMRRRLHKVGSVDHGKQKWSSLQLVKKTQCKDEDHDFILISGWGKEPNQETKNWLLQDYGLHGNDCFLSNKDESGSSKCYVMISITDKSLNDCVQKMS